MLRTYTRDGFFPILRDIETLSEALKLRGVKYPEKATPHKYSSFLFLSQIEILSRRKEMGWKVVSVDTPSTHRQTQSLFEDLDPASIQKRETQRTQILTEIFWGTQIIRGSKIKNPFSRQ
jgi:hypothetical protein